MNLEINTNINTQSNSQCVNLIKIKETNKTICLNYIKKIDESDDNLIKEKLYYYFGEFIKTNISGIKRDVVLRRLIYKHYAFCKPIFKIPCIFDFLSVKYDKDKFIADTRALLNECAIASNSQMDKVRMSIVIYNKILNNIVFLHDHSSFSITVYKKAHELKTSVASLVQKYTDKDGEQLCNLLALLNEYFDFMHIYYPERCPVV